MNMFLAANRLFRFSRRHFKTIERVCFVWVKFRTTAKHPSSESYVANLLLVKDPVYCTLATICLSSFFHHHPKSQAIINVDSLTKVRAEVLFKREIKSNRVNIKMVGNSLSSWQDQKIDLILGIKGENEFFIDADMRWNGVLPKIEEITFFVDEFKFAEKSPYAQLQQSEKFKEYENTSMKNTSFVSWGNYNINSKDRESLAKIKQNLKEINESKLIPSLDKKTITRLSEQIVLSCFVETLDSKVSFLKSKDGHMDGNFLESSYYGETGIQF